MRRRYGRGRRPRHRGLRVRARWRRLLRGRLLGVATGPARLLRRGRWCLSGVRGALPVVGPQVGVRRGAGLVRPVLLHPLPNSISLRRRCPRSAMMV